MIVSARRANLPYGFYNCSTLLIYGVTGIWLIYTISGRWFRPAKARGSKHDFLTKSWLWRYTPSRYTELYE